MPASENLHLSSSETVPVEPDVIGPEPGGSIHEFGIRRAALLREMERVRAIALERADRNSADSLAGIEDKVAASRFHLAVLGQFKRGKTTLINSLLGDDVLPVAVIPLTSIITLLRYGDQPQVTVHFLSGEVREIEMSGLPAYVTERGNPGNRKQVKHVEVLYPSPYLKDGVVLVDTPGIGSTYQRNTDVTEAFLRQVDAAIVLVSVDPPLTQTEAEFLCRIKEEVHRFFFVLNKIDQMNEDEVRESLAFTKARIEEQIGLSDIRVFPLSARSALHAKKSADGAKLKTSQLAAFERELSAFLMRDKGAVLLLAAVADTVRAASDLRFNIDLERRALAVPLEELRQKQATLSSELKRIEQERQDMNVLLKNEVLHLLSRVEEDLKRHVEDSLPEALSRLEAFYKEQSGAGKGELGRRFDHFTDTEVHRVFNQWRLAEDRNIGEAFREMSARFTGKTNAIIRGIQETASGLFNVSVETFASAQTLRADTRVFYKTDPLFQFALDEVTFVLPGFLFRRHVLNRMREKIRRELDRNSGRVRYDYLQRIEESTEEFRQVLNRKIDATLEGIGQALERAAERKRGSENDCRAYEETSRLHEERLSAVIAECRALSANLSEAELNGR
jgi:GTP-binding protein EngB required for normal cell division